MGYERVSTEAILKGKVRKEFAWTIISDYSRYENIMENVDRVNIIEKSATEGKSEWFVTVEEAPLKWVERDYYDVDNYELRFESIDGDFENINGKWKVEDFQNEGIKIYFSIDYNLGIPVIEEVLGHILKEKMKTNIDSMIHAIKEELTRTQADDRKFRRFNVGRYNNINLNGKDIRAYVVNISQMGMMFYYDGEFDAANVTVKIGNMVIEAESLFNDLKHKNSRIIFKKAVSVQQIEEMVKLLTTTSTRTWERQLVEKHVSIVSGGRALPIFLINISPKGMLFKYDDHFEWHDEPFDLAGIKLTAREMHHDIASRTVRIQFTNALGETEYAALLKRIKE
ncbi:MAG TPA: SRPBCC family protein [Chitinivibrionales bacterium]|nr:SRPBCC family protein [Chitinivibrionales bacterium]